MAALLNKVGTAQAEPVGPEIRVVSTWLELEVCFIGMEWNLLKAIKIIYMRVES